MTFAPELPDDRSEPAAGSGLLVTAAGGVVIDHRGGEQRVLVVHRPAYDDWSLPKGHVEAGEDPREAALREVAEETGVAARIVGELAMTRYRVGQQDKQVHWFLMDRAPGSAEPQSRAPDAEVDIAAWWDTTVAQQRLTHAADRTLLSSALARGGAPVPAAPTSAPAGAPSQDAT